MRGEPGMKFGSGYTLTTLLGAGNMGEVWQATRENGDDVAVKLLRSELAKDKTFVTEPQARCPVTSAKPSQHY